MHEDHWLDRGTPVDRPRTAVTPGAPPERAARVVRANPPFAVHLKWKTGQLRA
jgi:hypothetical protein